MLVLAAVSEGLAARLRRAAGKRFAFQPAVNWEEALNAILRHPVEMAVVDPGMGGQPRAREIERLRVLFPSLPVLLYTHLTPAIAAILLQLGSTGIRQILLAGHDDHPQRLGEALISEGTQAVSERLIAAISDLLADWPGELRWAIETMVRNPASVQSVQQLADRARMDRRTCLRWFARAALPPPSVILMVFRVVYAHRLLQDPGYTVEDIAARLGYAQTRSFAQNVKEVFGMTPGELRVRLSPDEALGIIRERYFGHVDRNLVEAS